MIYLENIKIMFKNVHPGRNHTLSMDEVASDGLLCYLTATDEICGPECATEGLSSVKMAKDLCVARAIRQAIREGKVHVGQGDICSSLKMTRRLTGFDQSC